MFQLLLKRKKNCRSKEFVTLTVNEIILFQNKLKLKQKKTRI